MPVSVAVQARGSGGFTLRFTSRTAGYNQVDIQVSTRPDFQFVPAPLLQGFVPDGNGDSFFGGLSPSNIYYARVRERNSSNGLVTAWAPTLAIATLGATAQDTAPLSIMVRPAIIVPPLPATWTASSQDASRPVSNLATDAPNEEFWGFVSGSGWIMAEMSGAAWDTVALLQTTLAREHTWRIRVADTSAGTTSAPVYDSGVIQAQASPNLPGRVAYHALHRLPSVRTERFVRIDFGDGGNPPPANILSMAYGVVGLARTAKNIAADKVETPLDYGSIERGRDGTPDRRAGFRGRRVEFEIALMTEAQWETQFADLRNKIGLTDPVLVVPNTRAGAFLHDRILFGPLASQKTTQPYTPRFTQGFAVESLI